jgi:hypothetical protein
MFSSGAPRGALWLTGGILATVLGAVVNQVFHDGTIAVIVGVVFAVAFGAAVERMVTALNRRTGSSKSPPSSEVSVDEVRAGDQNG